MTESTRIPSPSCWYRLTNNFTGTSLALDVVNDGGSASSGTLQMAPTGNYSGQYWRFIRHPSHSSPTFALYTMFLGPNKRLDVYGDDKTKPHLADAGNYSGQIWALRPWSDGTWQLTNSYSGSELHLDFDTKVLFMGDGDHTGQHWTFTPIADVEPTGSELATPTASPSPRSNADARSPSPSSWYRLTNNFTGTSLALDVVNDGGSASSGILQMAPTGNYSGQYWRFIRHPSHSSPTFALYTMFLGPNKRLDVYGDDKTKPHLADAGNYSGQIWALRPWSDGTWQLTNSYSGSDLHLDVYFDTKVPFMGDGDHTGQHWTFTPIADVVEPTGSELLSQGSTSPSIPLPGGATTLAHTTASHIVDVVDTMPPPPSTASESVKDGMC